ncbi:helix-turn-helix domain-containing protein [Streptomyces sp. NPDC051677]|uniref:helix-turn-helix domain-containing protein n=1 Tax=Streptomyces sp. NPDC051677 TaxID=3365669 RepID=UPI0037D0E6D4
MTGRPRSAVVLTEDERAVLLKWVRSRTCSQARALRARIVLACEEEPTNTAVARRLGVSRGMVGTWRARFLAERLDGLDEHPHPGRPPTVDDDTVAHVIVRTLTPPPSGDRQAWSTRSMAAETGLSQSTVSRIWRTYRVQPRAPATVGPRRAWSLPDHAGAVIGLFIAPPVCVLAVTARTAGRAAVRSSSDRMLGQDRETPHVLAVACAFAALRGEQRPKDAAWADHPSWLAFLEQVTSAASAGTHVHLLAYGVPAEGGGTHERPDTTLATRPRWHHAPSPEAWTDEIRRLLVADAPVLHEVALDPLRLHAALLSWSTTWTRSAAPFSRIALPCRPYDIPAICTPDNDSNARDMRALGKPALPPVPQITSTDAPPRTDPVVGLLREALLAATHRPGDRVREAPFVSRFGLSRRIVRAGLRALAEEGMLDLLPSGATVVPTVTAKDVLDLYALRASLGALLIRRVAMLGREQLAPAGAALAQVHAAARDSDNTRISEADLSFQDTLARTADLPQAAHTFERLTARLRMVVTVLSMDYSQACDTIADEDTAVYDALLDADGNEAARLWRVKIERCVRYMIAQLPEDDVTPHLWTTLAGRPRLRGSKGLRGAQH